MAVTPAKDLIISGDEGPGSLVIVWDAATLKAVRTLDAPDKALPGVRNLDVSVDGRFLAGLTPGSSEISHDQFLCIWDLTSDQDAPVASARVAFKENERGDPHLSVRFKSWSGPVAPGKALPDDLELVTNGKTHCCFWTVSHTAEKGARLVRSDPEIRREDFADFGDFTVSVFVPETTKAISGTANGDVVVWELSSVLHGATKSDLLTRQAVQVMRLHMAPITCLAVCGARVISAGTDGLVRFYDRKLKLEAWFEHLHAGGITSISFDAVSSDVVGLPVRSAKEGTASAALTPAALSQGKSFKSFNHAMSLGYSKSMRSKSMGGAAVNKQDKDEPIGASLALQLFTAPDFTVGTTHGQIVRVNAAGFKATHTADSSLYKEVLTGISGPVVALAAHPSLNKVSLITARGTIEQWDLTLHKRIRLQEQPKKKGSALAYGAGGAMLAVGFATGHVVLKDDETLTDQVNFRNTSATILEMVFTADGQYLAYSDATFAVGVYARTQVRGVVMWEFLGKYRIAHEGPICLSILGPDGGEDSPEPSRVFTAGPDGRVSEFEVNRMRPRDGMRLVGSTKIHMAGRAMSLCLAPPGLVQAQTPNKGPLLVHADDQLKIHFVDPDNKRKALTLAGPSYAHKGLQLLTPFQRSDSGRAYLAFALPQRIVGLIGSPMDSRPDPSVAVLAHPGPISGLGVTGKRDCLVTTSAEDSVMHLWKIDYAAFETAISRHHEEREAADVARSADQSPAGTSGGSAWVRALDGGEGGELHQLLKDYFYYAQVSEHSSDTLSARPRDIRSQIQSRRLPDLLKALGCFLDESQVRELLIDYRERQSGRGRDPNVMNLEDLAEMYLAYRPTRVTDERDMMRALRELNAVQHGSLNPSKLAQGLMERGEQMTAEELTRVLAVLLGVEELNDDVQPEELLKHMDVSQLLGALG